MWVIFYKTIFFSNFLNDSLVKILHDILMYQNEHIELIVNKYCWLECNLYLLILSIGLSEEFSRPLRKAKSLS